MSADDGGEGAAVRIATGMAVRAAVALGYHGARLIPVDLGGGRGDLGLPPGLLPATVTSPAAFTRVLIDLLRRAELLEVARNSNAFDALTDEILRPVVLLLLDAPTLWEAEALPLLDSLLSIPSPGVQVVLTGSEEPPRVGSPAEQRLLATVWSTALRLPSAVGGQLTDAFAQAEWVFLPDPGPSDPAGWQRLVAGLGPIEGWRDGILPGMQ